MKLVKMADEKIGIFVQLPNGAYAIDIAANLGFFLHDPLSYSLLNGALKDGHDWSLLVKHWADFACAFEETTENPARMSGPFFDFESLTDIPRTASAANPIIAIEITDTEIFEEQDPTGRRTMERQFMSPPASEPQRNSTATKTAQVIEFSSGRGDSSRRQRSAQWFYQNEAKMRLAAMLGSLASVPLSRNTDGHDRTVTAASG